MSRKLLTAIVLAAGPLLWGSAANAAFVAFGTSTQNVTVALTAAQTFTVTFANPVSGVGPPAYSFNGVGPLTFGPPATAAGGAAFTAGAAGTFTLAGNPPNAAITWVLLDGDGAGYTLNFRTTLDGNAVLGDLTLSPPAAGPANFTA